MFQVGTSHNWLLRSKGDKYNDPYLDHKYVQVWNKVHILNNKHFCYEWNCFLDPLESVFTYASRGGDPPISFLAFCTSCSTHSRLTFAFTGDVVAILVSGSHGITGTLLAATTRVDVPITKLALVAFPIDYMIVASTRARFQIALGSFRSFGMAVTICIDLEIMMFKYI